MVLSKKGSEISVSFSLKKKIYFFKITLTTPSFIYAYIHLFHFFKSKVHSQQIPRVCETKSFNLIPVRPRNTTKPKYWQILTSFWGTVSYSKRILYIYICETIIRQIGFVNPAAIKSGIFLHTRSIWLLSSSYRPVLKIVDVGISFHIEIINCITIIWFLD